MRFKLAVIVAVAASLSIFGSARAADHPAQDNAAAQDIQVQTPIARSDPTQESMGGGMSMGQGMGGGQAMGRPQETARRAMGTAMMRKRGASGGMLAGLLRPFSRMEAALDNPRVRARLKLTDQQADSLRKIILDAETFTITTGANIIVNGIEERELLRADNPDKGAVMSKGDAISKSISALIQRLLNDILQAKSVLTPAQQQMIREYMESRGQRMRMGIDMRFPGPNARPVPGR